MAIRFWLLCMVLVLALSLAMEVTCDGEQRSGAGGAPTVNYSRKILVSSAEVLQGLRRSARRSDGKVFSWNMRKVPSGPDPLHHNRSPKNPETP
ncbi:uncharacterized protein [Aristolochia californica]|uniref:uncharacterized protein n=1 Tax=Aristolochia californica TaxID=171875 RepID=UPI0035D732BD